MIHQEDRIALATSLNHVATMLDQVAALCRSIALQLDPPFREIQMVELSPDGDGDISMKFIHLQDGQPTGARYQKTLDHLVPLTGLDHRFARLAWTHVQ